MNIEELREALSKHTGVSSYSMWPRSRLGFSDGVVCFVKHAGGSWFVDILATEPVVEKMVMTGSGYVMVVLSSKGSVTISDEKDMLVMPVPASMCPSGQWKFYLKRTKDKKGGDIFVLMLMTENIENT